MLRILRSTICAMFLARSVHAENLSHWILRSTTCAMFLARRNHAENLSLTPIELRLYFQAGSGIEVRLSNAATSQFNSLSLVHNTNSTQIQMANEIYDSVEQAVYQTLYKSTTVEITSQDTCIYYNHLVNTNCILLKLKATVDYYEHDYFKNAGYLNFKNMMDFYTSKSFVAEESLQQLTNKLKENDEFAYLLEIRSQSKLRSKVKFEDSYKVELDPRIKYDESEKNSFISMAERPDSILFYSTFIGVVVVVMMALNDKRHERREKIIQKHMRSLSEIIQQRPTDTEQSSANSSQFDDATDWFLRKQ